MERPSIDTFRLEYKPPHLAEGETRSALNPPASMVWQRSMRGGLRLKDSQAIWEQVMLGHCTTSISKLLGTQVQLTIDVGPGFSGEHNVGIHLYINFHY